MPGLNLGPDELLECVGGDASFETGRKIVVFHPEVSTAEIEGYLGGFGPSTSSRKFFADGGMGVASASDASSVVFDSLNMAIISGDDMPMGLMAEAPQVMSIEPELFVFPSDVAEVAAANDVTWGLQATCVPASIYSGLGIRVAVLDTGMDLHHPDFAGRTIVSYSAVPGQTPQDGNGHGTHCIGTACGPRSTPGVGRYGIACDSEIYVGKVLSNTGTGTTGTVLDGMDWAIRNGCQVISMSLGAAMGEYLPYTQAGQRALNAGCLIIAAAGNESRRPRHIAPTGAPGNSPTIVAVAALDNGLAVAPFSCGGKVEIAAPGVDVLSSLPMPRRYGTLSGTSMATPHVAGIAALYAESNPAYRGAALQQALAGGALGLPLPGTDVGSGLVQAP